MPELPLVGVTAVIAGMAAFNRDAAIVESRLVNIGRASRDLEAASGGAFGGVESAFGSMATTVATGATLVAGALVLGGGLAIKFAADFQQSMAVTQAITGATDTEVGLLTTEIENLARKGTIGMKDLSEGVLELGRSGVTVPEILGGALKAVQDLTIASGGEISLKGSADLVASSMHAFGLEVTDITRITTAATVVAQNSTATFSGWGQAVAIAGPSFRAAGFSLEDLAIAETLVTQKGQSASVAATALRGVIQRLEKPSKDAAKVMEQYGIHLFDAQGKGVGLRAVIGQLNDAFSDEALASGKITEQHRAQALATLGLQRTSVAMFDLMIGGVKAFDDLALSFDRLRAEDLVTIVLKPLNAQAEIAFNNIQVLARAFGSSFLPAIQEVTGPLVFFLQNISTDSMVQFGKQVSDAGRAIVDGIGGAVAAAGALLAQMGLTAAAGTFLKDVLVGMGIVVLSVLVPPLLTGIAAFASFAIVIGVVSVAVQAIAGFVSSTANAIRGFADTTTLGGRLLADAMMVVRDGATALAALLRGDFATASTFAGLAMHDFSDLIIKDGGAALDALGHKLDEVGAQWAPWAAEAGPAGVVVSQSITGVHQVVEALAFLLQGNFAAAGKDAEAALASFGRAIDPIVTAVRDTLAGAFTYLTDTVWPAVQSAADKVGKAFDAVGTFAHDAVQKVAEQGAYDDLKTIWDNLQKTGDNLHKIFDDVLETVRLLVQPFLDLAAAADTAHGSLGPTADSMDSIANSAKAVTAALAAITATFAGVSAAIDGTIQFFNNILRVIADVTGFIVNLLGVGDDLKQAWHNLEVAGQALQGAVTNIGLVLSDLQGPLSAATGGVDLLKLAAQVLGGIIGLPLALLIKTTSLVIEAITIVIKEAAQGFAGFIESVRTLQLNFAALAPAMGAALDAVLGQLPGWAANVESAIRSFVGRFTDSGGALGGAIVFGLVTALGNGIRQVAAQAAAMGAAAIAAAREAVGAHSPSREFELLGQDMAEGLNIGLLTSIPKAKAAVKTYGDSILSEMATFVDNVEKASRDIGDKLGDIATKASRSVADLIDKANHDIQTSIDQTQSALDRLGGSEADLSSFVAREHAIQNVVNAEKDAFRQKRQDEEEAFRHTKELLLADSSYKKNVDLENSKFHQAVLKEDHKFEDDLAAARTSKQRADLAKRHDDQAAAILQSHKDALANLEIRHNDDIEAANKRFEDQKVETARRRELDKGEREFIKAEDAKITEFKQQQLIIERDTKIKSIEDAEVTNVSRVQRSADDQRNLLLRSYVNRIADLKDQLLDKIPPLTGAAADVLQSFMTRVEEETASTTQQIVDSFGTTVTESVDAVGDDANLVLGHEGVVPKAANITTKAFGVTTDAAGDLRGDKDSGFLGAKDAATQISFVLQQLDDRMPHLVQGIKDLVDAINQLHDKTVTITTVHKDVGGGGGSTRSSSDAVPVPIGEGSIPEFGHGGVVPGPFGAPVLAIVHGGEFIAALHSEASRFARQLTMAPAVVQREYNYNVNATYANEQSPASVSMDMRALVALSKGA